MDMTEQLLKKLNYVGLSFNGEKPESGYDCSKCGEYVSDISKLKDKKE